MKKILKNKLFLIVLLCIISCGIGVYAGTTYSASSVLYKASDGTSMNVNDALNDIYNIKTLGTATSGDIVSGKTAVVQGKLITGTLNSISSFKIVISTSATASNSSGNTNASANVTYTYSNGTWAKGTVNKSSGSSAYIWSQSINDINATITFD